MSDQPPANRPRKLSRPALIVAGTLTVAVGVSVVLAATSGHKNEASLSSKVADSTQAPTTSSSSSSSNPVSSSAAAAVAGPRSSGSAPWSSNSCPSQMTSWRSTGAGGQLQVVVTDLTIALQAATSMRADPASGTIPQAAVTALNSANASLRVSTQAAGKNLIPGCVSGANRAEVAALTDLGRAVAGFDNAVSQSASGNYGAAQLTSQTAVAALQTGSAKMATAIVDANGYGTK
jgi:hypothetical protein